MNDMIQQTIKRMTGINPEILRWVLQMATTRDSRMR